MDGLMEKKMILLAGYPGTGKSYLANMLMKENPDLKILSPDDIKEEYWDEFGYDTLTEKEALIQKSWEAYYKRMEKMMTESYSFISDYPFSKKQKSRLEELSIKYQYKVITVRMVGDIQILYERQRKRDLDQSRHLGHMMNHYHKGDFLKDRTKADSILSYEEFFDRCTTRGYDTFTLGKTYEIDVSDFARVDYNDIIKKIAD